MTLRNLIESLPPGLSASQINRRAMRFLLHMQYVGRSIPDCKSLEQLMF